MITVQVQLGWECEMVVVNITPSEVANPRSAFRAFPDFTTWKDETIGGYYGSLKHTDLSKQPLLLNDYSEGTTAVSISKFNQYSKALPAWLPIFVAFSIGYA